MTWQVAHEPQAVRQLVRKLEREAPGPVRACYEAGPCGYALQRQMKTPRVECHVIAPALLYWATCRTDQPHEVVMGDLQDQDHEGAERKRKVVRPKCHEAGPQTTFDSRMLKADLED